MVIQIDRDGRWNEVLWQDNGIEMEIWISGRIRVYMLILLSLYYHYYIINISIRSMLFYIYIINISQSNIIKYYMKRLKNESNRHHENENMGIYYYETWLKLYILLM